MHKNLSVLALLLEVKMKWVLITLGGMFVLGLVTSGALMTTESGAATFQAGFGPIAFRVIFAVGSFLTALICSGRLSGRGHQRYLMTRLRISERRVLLWEIAACTLFMLLLWMTEIVTLGTAGLIHNSLKGNLGGTQDVFFAMYLNPFYSKVIPMKGGLAWLGRLFCVIGSGVACACVTMYTGNSASRGMGLATIIATAIAYVVGWNLVTAFFTGMLMLVTIVLTIRRLHSGKERTEDETEDF